MADWGLLLAGPLAQWNRSFRVRSLSRVLDYYDARAKSARSANEAYENQEERRHVIEEFLEDPGYADEATFEAIHAAAPDALGAEELATYRSGPWQRHCALRLAETLVHLTLLLEGIALVMSLWTGTVARYPVAAEMSVAVWAILLYADLIWTVYLARVARALLLNNDHWFAYSFDQLIDLTAAGLPWWQRPAAMVMAPIAKRLGPPGVKTRTA